MLTTTVDGLWVLQVLSGIEILAPELGLRPYLPSAESRSMALSHPAAAELCQAGVITPGGDVDDAVSEWLTVLSRRDVALLLRAQTPGVDDPDLIVMARLAQWWVCAERFGSLVRLCGAGTAVTEADAGVVVGTHIGRLCGELTAAEFRPVSMAADRLVAHARDGAEPRDLPVEGGLDPVQRRILEAAGDIRTSAQVSIVALQSHERPRIAEGTVTIIDTPHGRLLSERVDREGRTWMIVGPGSASAIRRAVIAMLRRTSARAEWYCHRKVVQ